ncbi:MAG: hypothetical protein J6K13_03620 [Clostridia bacterium]|nr:hypothetical protein [Clostridia bacterium]
MKKLMCVLMAMLMMLSAASAEEWCSIADIREQTPARWTQTYETKWRTITIDAAIEVPQVEAFPILKVRKMPVVDESLLPADADVRYNAPGWFQFYTGKAEYVMKSNTMFKSINHYPGPELPDVLAEDCSFTPQDALDLAYERINHLYGMDSIHFRLDETLVYSRIWQYKGKKSNPTYTKAITDEGSYKVELWQLLYGVPYFACNETGDGYEPGSWLSDARVSVAHRGADGYMVLTSLWQVEEVVYADVPLLSFADAKLAFEKEIMAGRLRTVDTIALGCAPYTDPTDPDVFWLLPVWYVKGGYTTDSKREFTPFYDVDGSIADDGIERREIVFEAQQDDLIDYTDSRKNRRRVPTIVTWETLR